MGSNVIRVHSTQKATRLLVLLFLMVGGCAFIADVISPATPTPLIWPRVAFHALLVLIVIRLLGFTVLYYQEVVLVRRPWRASLWKLVPVWNVLDLTCVQLR
jgi:hypothetical protein